jgi:16S rRNA (guanine527-N7)-methyltransferase
MATVTASESSAASALRAQIDEIASNLELALSSSARNGLIRYITLLTRWGKTYNLTGTIDPHELLHQHVADALAALAALEPRLPPDRIRIADIGSGAGLPGAVWAIARPERLHVTTIDSAGKKISFQHQVAAELRLTNLQPLQTRVESHRPARPYDVITARAYAPLPLLIASTRHLIAAEGVWAALKSRAVDEELGEAEEGDAPATLVERIDLNWPGKPEGERNLILLKPTPPHPRQPAP